MTTLQLVWFKRDLRVRDHWPLQQACAAGPVLALYCFEPSQWQQADASARHLGFVQDSLRELEHDLAKLGLRLWLYHGEVCAALQQLRAHTEIAGLWSHEETGNLASYGRDKAVAAWCRQHGVHWREIPQYGVIRRLTSRNAWAGRWEQFMAAEAAPLPRAAQAAQIALAPNRWPDARELALPDADIAARQRGGRRVAVGVLSDFLAERAAQYRGGISSPLKASSACSRLSPYLAWGNLSLREVVQAKRRHVLTLQQIPEAQRPRNLLPSLASFEQRLHWHCHFIQKLESEPEIELHNMHRGYDGLREQDFRSDWFEAWALGQTGYPLIDACMAQLQATGWVNFRMRAMLISFASYNLWLHWRAPAHHLARLFTDYEPGIHYPQVQMQSGVTGINALRIYNPIKQAQEHDPHGHFVRQWLPVLRRVPDAYLFEPWQMPSALQAHHGVRIGHDYPAPLVDFSTSLRAAKARFSAWREQPGLRELARAVFDKHGSRRAKAEREWGRRKRPPPDQRQLGLFEEA
jgi:deoxyribodipyrimidine photo-lyase